MIGARQPTTDSSYLLLIKNSTEHVIAKSRINTFDFNWGFGMFRRITVRKGLRVYDYKNIDVSSFHKNRLAFLIRSLSKDQLIREKARIKIRRTQFFLQYDNSNQEFEITVIKLHLCHLSRENIQVLTIVSKMGLDQL